MTTAFRTANLGSPPQVADLAISGTAPVRPRRLPAEVYRRRRITAAVVVAMFIVLVAWSLISLAGAYFTGVANAATEPVQDGERVTIVQPGDTVWAIASSINTDGDLRDTVDVLVELNGSSALTVGQRLVLPAS